jgi:serine/threonine-protein kinase
MAATSTHNAGTVFFESAADRDEDSTSTIEAPSLPPGEATRRAVENLPSGVVDGLELGVTLGEGGMGIVRTATQLSLGRRVAVKTLRHNAKTPEATLRLLREGWVTGSLEHPNIVPVHDLGLDAGGAPLIVFKHIEGVLWSDLIHDASAVKARFGATDLLEYNLRILLQVCHAVSFAHSRGILHRDLKPENVMIGLFGEVYLVDWGIAVSLRDDPSGRFPLASDVQEPIGTPAYMAPEMLGDLGPLTERTDVYLLGAVLFEILTARAPHSGERFRDVIAAILRSKPELPSGLPPELTAIVTRAMSRDPADRHGSVAELRERIEWYLRHRGSLTLSAEAALRVGELRSVLAGGGEVDAVRDRIHHLFAEARFGFRQAIRACDDNEAARAGLRDVAEMVVTFELDHGNVEAAVAALAELDPQPPELAGRVAAALEARESEKARIAALEKLSADLDPSTGRAVRVTTVVFLCVLWTIPPLVMGWLSDRGGAPPRWLPYAHTTFHSLIVVAVYFWKKASLVKSAINRLSVAAVLLMFAMQFTLEVGANLLGLPLPAALALHLFGWTFAAGAFSILIEPRFKPATFGFLAAFLAVCVRPVLVWDAMSISTLILCANAFTVWSARRTRSAIRSE